MSVEEIAKEARSIIDKYDKDAAEITAALIGYIDENYGERCKDFDENCTTCRLWYLFDQFEAITR